VGLAIDKCFGMVDIHVIELEMDITVDRSEHRAIVSLGSLSTSALGWLIYMSSS